MYNATARKMTVPQPTHPDWLSVNQMHVNLRRAYLATTDAERAAGIDWYPNALHFAQGAAHAHGIATENAVVALVHLSPRTSWQRNKNLLLELLATGEARTLGAAVRKARLAVEASDPFETLKSPKVSAFARNILGDYEPVTVDRWAARMADPNIQGVTKVGLSLVQYEQIERAYRQCAKGQSITPAELQAVLWVAARGKAE